MIMSNSNYTITNDISKATHWLSYSDEESCVKEWIIPNKVYELVKLIDPWDEEDEYFIKSEDGNYSMYYLCFNGDFIIRKEN